MLPLALCILPRWTEAYKHSKPDIKYTNGITDTEKLFDTRKWKSIWSSISVAVARRHFLSRLFWWQQWIRWIIKSNVELCSAKCEMQFFSSVVVAGCVLVCVIFSGAQLYQFKNRRDVMNLKQRTEHTSILSEMCNAHETERKRFFRTVVNRSPEKNDQKESYLLFFLQLLLFLLHYEAAPKLNSSICCCYLCISSNSKIADKWCEFNDRTKNVFRPNGNYLFMLKYKSISIQLVHLTKVWPVIFYSRSRTNTLIRCSDVHDKNALFRRNSWELSSECRETFLFANIFELIIPWMLFKISLQQARHLLITYLDCKCFIIESDVF